MKYNIITNIDKSTDKDRADGNRVRMAVNNSVCYGPAAEEAICPSRYPAPETADMQSDEVWLQSEAAQAELMEIAADLNIAV